MTELVNVKFLPDGKRGSSLSEAAMRAGVVLTMPCGGLGQCGKCRVLPQPLSSVVSKSNGPLSDEEVSAGWRLACMTRVVGDVRVEVPAASRFYAQRILTSGKGREVPLSPRVVKRHARISTPASTDTTPHVSRLFAAAGLGRDTRISLSALKDFASLLAEGAEEVTCVVSDGELTGVEAGDTAESNFGAAIDLGTTTITGKLVNLSSGKELGTASRVNPQAAFSDDVVGRVAYVDKTADGLEKLQGTVVKCINDLLRELWQDAECGPEHIHEVVVVGNTVMLLLLLGASPTVIARAPYATVHTAPMEVKAATVGLSANREAILRTLPCVAGFMGADAISAAMATGLLEAEKPQLLIDVGTNTETMLCVKGKILGCSAAAGPAFEGARIGQGMVAARGAIDRVRIEDGKVHVTTVGGGEARGVCGSGLLDAVAELRKAGVVEESGKMVHPGEVPANVPSDIRKRIRMGRDGPEFVLADEEEALGQTPIILTQKDVREFQLAKGAIRAAVEILLREAGLKAAKLGAVHLAGGFGNYLRKESALAVGLLPPMPPDKIGSVGNAACEGAKMALVCGEMMEEAERIAEATDYVELAAKPKFMEELSEAMFLGER